MIPEDEVRIVVEEYISSQTGEFRNRDHGSPRNTGKSVVDENFFYQSVMFILILQFREYKIAISMG